jgi:hypothetical protein
MNTNTHALFLFTLRVQREREGERERMEMRRDAFRVVVGLYHTTVDFSEVFSL